jgi:hypothetical protein
MRLLTPTGDGATMASHAAPTVTRADKDALLAVLIMFFRVLLVVVLLSDPTTAEAEAMMIYSDPKKELWPEVGDGVTG